MPAYSFQEQFVQKILDKSKPHTIRRRRKRPTVPGDMLSLYTGLRTKNCKLIATAPCILVEKIIIFPWKAEILIADNDERGKYRPMKKYAVDALARHDGFENISEFFTFFTRHYPLETMDSALDDFEIIHWDTNLLKPNIENLITAKDER